MGYMQIHHHIISGLEHINSQASVGFLVYVGMDTSENCCDGRALYLVFFTRSTRLRLTFERHFFSVALLILMEIDYFVSQL